MADPMFFVLGGSFLVLGIGMFVHAWVLANDPVGWPRRRPPVDGQAR